MINATNATTMIILPKSKNFKKDSPHLVQNTVNVHVI